MRKAHRVYIPLVGGIGNQLFILNFGKMLSSTYDVELISTTDWMHDKKSYELTGQLASAFDLKINHEMEITFIERKIINAFFRAQTLSKNKSSVARILAFTIKVFGSLLYKFAVSRRCQISVFEPDSYSLIPELNRDTTLVGYFQNNLIVDRINTNNALDSVLARFPEKNRLELERFISKYSTEESILVHHRLGDYQSDKLFANLPESYFTQAILKQSNKNGQLIPLVLTNDVTESKKFLNSIADLRYLDDEIQLSTLEWIIFGREFSKYVLSNSTFGWWMAFLSKNAKCVVYPDPWFANLHYDLRLTPQEWNRLRWEWRD